MNIFNVDDECEVQNPEQLFTSHKDTTVQLVLALVLGIASFVGFCYLRPKWKSLFAARKQVKNSAATLPELPDTLLGWVPTLWAVTEQQVLASAGLDAFVFLSFFKMAIRFLAVAFIITAVIITPINNHFVGLPSPFPSSPDQTRNNSAIGTDTPRKEHKVNGHTSFVWSYLVFTYVFTALALYLLLAETRKIIRVRQDYLGSQSTVTDRTIKLSGIPKELQSEEQIKETIENLEIGRVENVTLCRNWSKLDKLMDDRNIVLRKLEDAWAVDKSGNNGLMPGPAVSESSEPSDYGDEESEAGQGDNLLRSAHVSILSKRPRTNIRHGFLNVRRKSIDAMEFYSNKLESVDKEILAARKAEYKPTSLAFVTMDSTAACQMAMQALIDPSPRRLLAGLAPAPDDIVWRNTYLSRPSRMMRSWSIAIFIGILTILWLIPVASLASLLNLCTIRAVWPGLANTLYRHEVGKALVQTGLPTLVVSLLNVAVPYLYDWLSNKQGSLSQSEVELSVISKNFAFTFFNFFLVFTVFGTATSIWPILRDSVKDTTEIAYFLAQSLEKLGVFYTNFILLQGVGLFPLRLLQFGSIATYPIMRMGAKTPRDFAELVQPGVFSFGFYLPPALLIYILCIIYSILPAGFMVLFFGLIYFIFGYFVYKYQLLYSMDHPHHATGGAWSIIVYRIILGLEIFQLAMAGVIALRNEYYPAVLVLPLLPFTAWLSIYYSQTYEPLTRFIALRSIRRDNDSGVDSDEEEFGISRGHERVRRGSTLDEDREKGQRFINPNLVIPLEKLWIEDESTESHESSNPRSNHRVVSNYEQENVWSTGDASV